VNQDVRAADGYQTDYYEARSRWLDRRVEAKLLLDLARLSPRARVLDIGCGDGVLLGQAVARGAHAVGLEVNQSALKLARDRIPDAWLIAVARSVDLPFQRSCFDAVVSQHVLEHLDAAAGALEAWWRVVRPGGYVTLATPNAAYPDPSHFADPDHRRLWTKSELAWALRSAGFEHVHCWTVFPFFGRGRFARALSVRVGASWPRLPAPLGRGRTLIAVARRPWPSKR